MKPETEKSLVRGIEWLIAQQAEDGGWHSKTYGQLKDGAALTALAVYVISYASLRLPDRHYSKSLVNGHDFLNRGFRAKGVIASPDGTVDFPTYAAALSLASRRLFAYDLRGHNEVEPQLVQYLIAAQVAEARGFAPNSPSYGGWDFLGKDDARGITTGTNISISCYVLEALAMRLAHESAGNLKPPQELVDTIARGKAYTLRCQQADAGFAFTCEPASLNNKAAYSDTELTKPRSYGTATCDGIRALIDCGAKSDEEPITKAIAWLAKRTGLELVPGFEGFPPEAGWDRGLRFYYYASLSRVLPLFPLSDRAARGEALTKHVIDLQKDDGQWVNESDRMRENDPLIATALALTALS